jgi:hypothetical protein
VGVYAHANTFGHPAYGSDLRLWSAAVVRGAPGPMLKPSASDCSQEAMQARMAGSLPPRLRVSAARTELAAALKSELDRWRILQNYFQAIGTSDAE